MGGEATLCQLEDNSLAPTPGGAPSVPKREKNDWDDAGPVGEFHWIDKLELYVDRSYQRDLKSTKKVVEIARNWDWALCGVLQVARRPDGILAVFNGQHRAVAATLRDDISVLPCMVFGLEGRTQEARKFIDANTMHSNVTPYERHTAGLVAGDETAVAAEEIVTKHRYEFTSHSDSGRTIKAVSTVHRIVDRDLDLADKVIGMCAELYDGAPMLSNVIKGVAWLGGKEDAIFRSPYHPRFVAREPSVVEAEITKHKMFKGKGGERVCGEAVLNLINEHRTTNRIVLE